MLRLPTADHPEATTVPTHRNCGTNNPEPQYQLRLSATCRIVLYLRTVQAKLAAPWVRPYSTIPVREGKSLIMASVLPLGGILVSGQR